MFIITLYLIDLKHYCDLAPNGKIRNVSAIIAFTN
jgi:hypothetical protein